VRAATPDRAFEPSLASEIARADGGALSVDSSPDETRLTFRMPLI
jgi:signal transduction histidine kinase